MNVSIPNGYPKAQQFTSAAYPGLSGKVVLNTGAGSGIGRAMAHAFARHGAALMLLDIDAKGLEQTKAELLEAHPGIDVETVLASITDDAAIENVCAATEARFGRIDILLNNAGISMNKPSLELTPAEWRRAIDIDLSGVFLLFASGRQAHGPPRWRGHSQHGLDLGAVDVQPSPGLLRSQGRGGVVDQMSRCRMGAAQHPCQRGLPRIHAYGFDGRPDETAGG